MVMNFFKNKYFLSLAFIAAVFFLSVSLGGEFLHDHIHHHESQKEHDDCPVYQLALQLIIPTLFFAFALPVFVQQKISLIRKVSPLSIYCAFPSPRAPPVSL
jgi:hypothetical protein